MEHACYKCGTTIEDGTAFCPQCSAPQIRVAGFESSAPAVFLPGTGQIAGIFAPGQIQWPHALPSAAIAGFVGAIITMFPLGAFLGMIIAGSLSGILYQRRNPSAILSKGMGAKLGAVSGAIGFGFFALFTSAEMLIFHSGGQFREMLLEAIQQSASRNSDPQAQEILEFFKSAPGLAWMMAIILVVLFVAFLIFSSVGGALGAFLLRRKPRA